MSIFARHPAASLRGRIGFLLAFWLTLPGTAWALAELEVLEWSRGGPGAPATLGYFNLADPDLVSHIVTVTPVGDGSGDVMAEYQYLYRDTERVNTFRNNGVMIQGTPQPGHSFAKAAGYAEAGVDPLGGSTNLGVSAFVFAGEHPSTAAAVAKTKIEVSFVIGAGGSGAAVGDTVTGLRWDFNVHGSLAAGGVTHPATTASVASMDFDAIILRGPTGMCGIFDCPRGALAARVDFLTSLSAWDRDPSSPGDPTGEIRRNRSWSASYNTAQYKAGGVFKSGSDSDVLAVTTTEGVVLFDVLGVHSGASPLNLDHIDFDATVGETLKLTADLGAYASLSGEGEADADLFGTFSTRVYDPLGRGYDLQFSIAPAPIPEPHEWLLLLSGLVLVMSRGRTGAVHPRS